MTLCDLGVANKIPATSPQIGLDRYKYWCRHSSNHTSFQSLPGFKRNPTTPFTMNQLLKNVCQTDQQKEKVDALFESTCTDHADMIAVYDFMCEVLSPDQLSEIEEQVHLKLANIPFDVEATPTTNSAISNFVEHLLEKFRLQVHVNQTNSHREYLKTVFEKFEQFVLQHPNETVSKRFGKDYRLNMMRFLVKHHDTSKYNLKMALGGYAKKIVKQCKICRKKRYTSRFNAIDRQPHHDSFWTPSNHSNIDTWVKDLHLSTDEREYLQNEIDSGDSLIPFFVLESVLDQTARDWDEEWWNLGGMEELMQCRPKEVFSRVNYGSNPYTSFGKLFDKIVNSLTHPKEADKIVNLLSYLKEAIAWLKRWW